MAENRLSTQIGYRISLPGHFDVPVILEGVRALGTDGSAGYECRVRLPDGTLEEAVISPAEQAALKKLVANWRALIDQRLAAGGGTLFDKLRGTK